MTSREVIVSRVSSFHSSPARTPQMKNENSKIFKKS